MDFVEAESLSIIDELRDTTKGVLIRLQKLSMADVPEDPLVENAEEGSNSSKPSRTRSRKNKKAPEKDVSSVPFDPIDHNKQFLLNLLSLPEEKWFSELKVQAINRGIISMGKGGYCWNSENGGGNQCTETFVAKLNSLESSTPSSRGGGSGKASTSGQRNRNRRFLNLDETINSMIPDSQYHVSLSPHKIRTEAELDQKMKKFAATLVKAGMGTIKEAELSVTQRGQPSFVRTDPEVILHKQKLRRCALHGDIVEVFVFKAAIDERILEEAVVAVSEAEDDDDDETTDLDDVIPKMLKNPDELEELAKCRATGFIIRVIKQVHDGVCTGQFTGTSTARTGTLTFMPHDMRIPPVKINARLLNDFIPKDTSPEEYFKNLPTRLFEVQITGSNSFYYTLTGKVLSDIGSRDSILDQNTCILLRHGFKKNRMDRLERLGESYVKQSQKPSKSGDDPKRRDLTKECIFTIDPATARDLDDAVSCKKLANGNYEVGVHISDVTHYVEENSDLDYLVQEAKTTSVYMVDQVYHMLPAILCQTCSLLPGEDKKAVSVFIEMTPDAQIVSKSFTRSTINSCCQLSYEQAQKFIDHEDPLSVAPMTIYNEFTRSDLSRTIGALNELAKVLRGRRKENGALSFDKPKFYFKLDDEMNPVEFLAEMRKPANFLIEEFMILANQVVGEYIYDTFPEHAILRQHSPPKLDQMAKVKAFFRELNFPDLHYRTAQEINASMAAILAEADKRQFSRTGFELVLNGLLARPMNRAQYFCTGDSRYVDRFEHFALSIPFYTHFTSPIRRYPDIMVHRLLIRAMNGQEAPKSWQMADVLHLMDDCNREKLNARYASEDSSRLFLRHYLRTRHPNGKVMRATVSNVSSQSVEVKLWDTGDELYLRHSELQMMGAVSQTENGTLVTICDEQDSLISVYLTMFSTCRVNVTVVKDILKATLVV